MKMDSRPSPSRGQALRGNDGVGQPTRYASYNDSSVEWLGEVPAHWKAKRIKELVLSFEQGWSPNAADWSAEIGGFGVLKLSAISNGSFHELNNKSLDIDKLPQNTLLTKKRSILISRSNTPALVADSCLVRITPYTNLVVPDLIFCLVFNLKFVEPEFISYYLNSSSFRWLKTTSARGLNDSMVKVSQRIVKNWTVFIPPTLEQTNIASYLDTKTSQIDCKINLLSQKAEKYGKLKQSLIFETVTRGLDKSVPMKDSGIEWVGEIPAHWEVKRLKDVTHIKTGAKDTIDNVGEGKYPFFVRSQTVEKINSYSFDGEAILTAGDGVGVGKVFHHIIGKFDYHQRVYKISHFRKVVGRFVFYYMKENFYKDALRLNAKSTVDSLRMPMFNNFPIPIGDVDEQRAIANYLDTKTEKIDRIIETVHVQINNLKELRKTLINDVVTGKIKVVE